MTPRTSAVRRRLGAGALALAVGGGTAGLVPAPAQAYSASTCDTATDLCVLNAATFTDAADHDTTLAAEPVHLNLDWNNTSTALSSNKDLWLSSVSFTSGDGATTGPVLTPGAELHDGLLVGGFPTSDDSCGSGGGFSSCTAGRGTALIEVTDALSNVSVRDATVGVHRIVSTTPTQPGELAHYRLTLEIYSAATALLNPITIDTTTDLVVAEDTGSGVTGTISVRGTATGSLGESYDYSLSSLHLSLLHRADVLEDGSAAGQSFVVARHPDTCAAETFSMAATDRAGTDLGVSYDFASTGCPTTPTALASRGTLPFLGTLTAGPSFEGDRPLAAKPYLWDFGDGTTDATAAASTSHEFPDSESYDITLTAVDVGGARSEPVTVHLDGSTITVGPAILVGTYGRSTQVVGTLKDFDTGTGLRGRGITVYSCDPGSLKRRQIGTGSTGAGGDYALGVHPLTPGLYCAEFAGEDGRLGIQSPPVEVRVRYAVALKTSKKSLAVGDPLRLYGTVGPNAAGETVLVQRYVRGRWKTLTRRSLNSKSHYSVRLAVNGKPGHAVKFRVVKRGSGGYLRGVHRAKVRLTQS